jgi:DNA-binding beta-propeller fold protein YncE
MQDQEVSTLFRAGNGVDRPRTIAYTLDYDTMIIANDAGNWTDIGTIIIVRDPVSGLFPQNSWQTVMNHKQCNGGAVHPISGEYWFNSYEKSQVYKVKDRSTIPWKYGNATGTNTSGQEGLNYVFLVQDNGWEFNIQIAPSGKFAYIVSRNKHYVARTEYNFTTGFFEKPQPYVGMVNKPGFLDGVGLNTQFRDPQQGAFDSQDNFYITDSQNHCIRKITPTGQVSTFAGRSENAGYSDGALRDAQFNSPLGIIYDEINQTFYVADRDNRRIRTIKVE